MLAPGAALALPRRVPGTGAIACVVVPGLVRTAIAFVIFAVLIHEAGSSRATVITYVNPLIALALGGVLLREHPGAGAVVAGLLLILAGLWLSTGGRLAPGLREWDPGQLRARRRARQVHRQAASERTACAGT